MISDISCYSFFFKRWSTFQWCTTRQEETGSIRICWSVLRNKSSSRWEEYRNAHLTLRYFLDDNHVVSLIFCGALFQIDIKKNVNYYLYYDEQIIFLTQLRLVSSQITINMRCLVHHLEGVAATCTPKKMQGQAKSSCQPHQLHSYIFLIPSIINDWPV